ncbi:MAG: hypothetical protein R2864_04510 [Syntrophotaleaceae bacterium]
MFKELLGYPGGLRSNCMITSAVMSAWGRPSGRWSPPALESTKFRALFNGRELRRIVGYHPCEESPYGNGYLMPAFETGIGAMVGVNARLILGTDDLEMVYRVPLPDTKCTFSFLTSRSLEDAQWVPRPPRNRKSSCCCAVPVISIRCRLEGQTPTGPLQDMLPAMIRGDLKGIGDAMFDLTFLGSKRAECEQHGSHGAPVYNYISTFREIGAEVSGMSSVGPTIFALTRSDDTYSRILKYLRSQGIPESRIIETAVDNVGSRIIENGVERIFSNDGWLHC